MSDINNGARRAIEYLVYGALPPHSTKVLWMDTSVPELPVLKIFWNGCWTPVHTDESKEIDLLVKTVFSQQETINQLENKIGPDVTDIKNDVGDIKITVNNCATEENATNNKSEIIQEIDDKAIKPSVTHDGSLLLFNMMSPYQVSKMVVLSNKGYIRFELTDHGTTSSLSVTSNSPQEVAGTVILSHFNNSLLNSARDTYLSCPSDYTFLNVQAPDLGFVTNILNEDLTWRIAGLEKDLKETKEATQAITGYALQGSGNNTLTDVYALIGYVVDEIDGV